MVPLPFTATSPRSSNLMSGAWAMMSFAESSEHCTRPGSAVLSMRLA
eukprot:CAMPEP_0202835700 /NCGR_PEP_ID=MMETSP1389-20130828/37829_1 /ASSEMBLY_ACC=CAM_ASM_000865 /TAXON_ID=302021 /ORGANISM="Rhodomonas sp., Strain CCMP768" /LENGTH=46 /DNA_ID= /DNA_START= /DNA_END= /DNA_ORIENTATION=